MASRSNENAIQSEALMLAEGLSVFFYLSTSTNAALIGEHGFAGDGGLLRYLLLPITLKSEAGPIVR